MSNKKFKKFIKELRSIEMTNFEKNNMRVRLFDFSKKTSFSQQSPSPYWVMTIRKTTAIAMVVILSIGSITNIVSGEALPGDMLYSLKITHEEIKQAITLDPIRKTHYEIKRTEKRIQEATKLVQKEKLDEKKESNLAESIRHRVYEIEKGIQKIESSNPQQALELQTSLKKTLQSHSLVLKETIIQKEISKNTPPLITEKNLINENENMELTNTDLDSKENQESNTDESTTELIPSSMLLDSLLSEVNKIEERERILEEKRLKKELKKLEDEKEKSIQEITKNINFLERILPVQSDIDTIKEEMNVLTLSTDFVSLTTSLEEHIDELVKEKKYKRAESLINELYELYKEYPKHLINEEPEDVQQEDIENTHENITAEPNQKDTSTLDININELKQNKSSVVQTLEKIIQ